MAERLMSYTLNELNSTNGDFYTFEEGFIETAAGATSDQFKKFTHGTQMALSSIASVLKKTADELQNGCPERKGEITGRLIFEALALIATPEVKLGELGNVARLGASQGKLLEVMAETTANGQKVSRVLEEVPAVATIVEGRIPLVQAELDVLTYATRADPAIQKLRPLAEFRGMVYAMKTLREMGWEVVGKLEYGSNNGIDILLKGTGPNAGRWGLVEAKGGESLTQRTLNSLKVDKEIKQRCFTKEWVKNRLGRLNPARTDLIDALNAGNVDLFITLEKAGANGAGQVWKIDPNLFEDTIRLPSLINGEAKLVVGIPN